MSELYSIQDTTLTALGDAIRNKVMGTTELPVSLYPKTVLSFLGTYPFEFPAYVKKIKITGKLEHNYTTYHTKLKGLGVAPIKSGSKDNVINDKNFVIVVDEVNGYEYGTNYDTDFEIIIDSNVFTFTAPTGENATPEAYLTYTAIGLDENGNEFKYTPLEMVDAINELMTIPDEALNLTGDCQYKFAYGGSDWLINLAGDKITTNNITNANYMFNNSKVTSIPFEINLANNANIQYLFNGCSNLKNYPQVNLNLTQHISFGQVFYSNPKLRKIPEWFVDLLEKNYNIATNNTVFAPWNSLFSYCYSLRTIPDRAMKAMYNPNPSSNYQTIAYSNPFRDCATLDELINIPCDNYAFTSNQFTQWFFYDLYRVKDITFVTNEDGTPMVRNWKAQTLALTEYIGYHPAGGWAATILGHNSGITEDKQVKDDVTYQALKDDPDWFSMDINYSRYNHDSAVRTINSLPDCSAYGTNIIKFKGASGALTDGGAINTLTEEEIAVATAKGWTVSFA